MKNLKAESYLKYLTQKLLHSFNETVTLSCHVKTNNNNIYQYMTECLL